MDRGELAEAVECLVNHDGVFDIRLMSYSTDIPGFQQAQNTAATWADSAAVERFNPIDHVAEARRLDLPIEEKYRPAAPYR